MATLYKDLAGAGYLRLDETGDEGLRVHMLDDLVGAPDSRTVTASTFSGVARKGVTSYPRRPDLICYSVAVFPTSDPQKLRIEERYRDPAANPSVFGSPGNAFRVDIETDFVTEETWYDVNGQPLSTQFTSTTSNTTTGAKTSLTEQRTHRVEVQRPTFALVITRTEAVAAEESAFTYSGAVNASTYRGVPADKYLLSVSSTQSSAGAHDVRYRFTFNSQGWQAQLVHTTSAGIIPREAVEGNGLATGIVYPRLDFNRLGLG